MRLREICACLLLFQRLVLVENKIFFSKAYDSFVIRDIYSVSLNDCKKECLQRSLCHSINYGRTSKSCELNKNTDGLRLQTRVGWLYSAKSSFVDATFSKCICKDGTKCIVSSDGNMYTCVIKECEAWPTQYRSNVATVGARSEHVCVLDIAKFDANSDYNKYVAPFVCASDGKWHPTTEITSKCYMIAFVLKPSANTDPYFAWVNGDNVRSDFYCLKSQSCQEHYRNSWIDRWNSLPITRVRFSVFKNQNEEHYIVFNGTDSSYMNWFSHARVTESSWSDLVSNETQLEELKRTDGYFFTMSGISHHSAFRRFYINLLYSECTGDRGWFSAIFVQKTVNGNCPYERETSIRYSAGGTAAVFIETEQADKVYVLLDLT